MVCILVGWHAPVGTIDDGSFDDDPCVNSKNEFINMKIIHLSTYSQLVSHNR
jgi:hypothetical protein